MVIEKVWKQPAMRWIPDAAAARPSPGLVFMLAALASLLVVGCSRDGPTPTAVPLGATPVVTPSETVLPSPTPERGLGLVERGEASAPAMPASGRVPAAPSGSPVAVTLPTHIGSTPTLGAVLTGTAMAIPPAVSGVAVASPPAVSGIAVASPPAVSGVAVASPTPPPIMGAAPNETPAAATTPPTPTAAPSSPTPSSSPSSMPTPTTVRPPPSPTPTLAPLPTRTGAAAPAEGVVIQVSPPSDDTPTPGPPLTQLLDRVTTSDVESFPGVIRAYATEALPGLAIILLTQEVAVDPPTVGLDSALKLVDRSGATFDLAGNYLDHRKGRYVNYSLGTAALAFRIPPGTYQVHPSELWLAYNAKLIGPADTSIIYLTLTDLPPFAVLQDHTETGVDVAPTAGLESSTDYLARGVDWLGIDYARARADLTEALRRDPTNAAALVARAEANERLGLLEEAKADLHRALEIGLESDDATAYALLMLSEFYEFEGDVVRQMEALEKAVGLGAVSAALVQRANIWLDRAAGEVLSGERVRWLGRALEDLDAALLLEPPDLDRSAGSYLSGGLYAVWRDIYPSTESPGIGGGESVLQRRGYLLAVRAAVLRMLGRDSESDDSLDDAVLFAVEPSSIDGEVSHIYRAAEHEDELFADRADLHRAYQKIDGYPGALRLRLYWADYWSSEAHRVFFSERQGVAQIGQGSVPEEARLMGELAVAEFTAAIDMLASSRVTDAPGHVLPLALVGRAGVYMLLGSEKADADLNRAEALGLLVDRERREILGFPGS